MHLIVVTFLAIGSIAFTSGNVEFSDPLRPYFDSYYSSPEFKSVKNQLAEEINNSCSNVFQSLSAVALNYELSSDFLVQEFNLIRNDKKLLATFKVLTNEKEQASFIEDFKIHSCD